MGQLETPSLVVPTTPPMTEGELAELLLLWGRIEEQGITVEGGGASDLVALDAAAGFAAIPRLLDEVGRLRGVEAGLRLELEGRKPPTYSEAVRAIKEIADDKRAAIYIRTILVGVLEKLGERP